MTFPEPHEVDGRRPVSSSAWGSGMRRSSGGPIPARSELRFSTGVWYAWAPKSGQARICRGARPPREQRVLHLRTTDLRERSEGVQQ